MCALKSFVVPLERLQFCSSRGDPDTLQICPLEKSGKKKAFVEEKPKEDLSVVCLQPCRGHSKHLDKVICSRWVQNWTFWSTCKHYEWQETNCTWYWTEQSYFFSMYRASESIFPLTLVALFRVFSDGLNTYQIMWNIFDVIWRISLKTISSLLFTLYALNRCYSIT